MDWIGTQLTKKSQEEQSFSLRVGKSSWKRLNCAFLHLCTLPGCDPSHLFRWPSISDIAPCVSLCPSILTMPRLSALLWWWWGGGLGFSTLGAKGASYSYVMIGKMYFFALFLYVSHLGVCDIPGSHSYSFCP